MTKNKQSGGVTIGNITGSIHGSIIAGRDVKDVTITVGGQPTPADKDPTFDEFKQLLEEIQQEVAEITAQRDILKEVSSATPFAAQGAEQSVKDIAERLKPEMKPEEAKSAQKSLTEATNLLSSILDGVKTVTQKAHEVGTAMKPIAQKIEPLVEKISVAALWVTKLWLMN